ncbi:MAG TPA: type I DNA topoisomerase [Bacillota bacterium]
MAKPLIIVESPAKARTIEKFLGRRYTVKASMGHVRDLPKSQFGVDVDDDFRPKYITIRGKGEVLKTLRDSAKKANKVFLATDPDREGEAISWHLAAVLGLGDDCECRVEFHEITKDAVTRAIKKPRSIDTHLVDAQQARRILDRIVGYRLSPLLWRKVRRGLSAGRVQSVAVRLITDREEEIKRFVKEEYWTIEARLKTWADGQAFLARYVGPEGQKVDLKTGAEVDRILADLRPASFTVLSVKRRERHRSPAPPFTTSSLQQEASRKLGFTVRRTMALAQQLYEGLDLGPAGTVGLVTYIRTDSTRVADEAHREARALIKERFGADFVPSEPRVYEDRRGAQGAHEAIRPTSLDRSPESVKESLTPEQYKLYRLVWERFLASEMSQAVLDTVTADIAAGRHSLRATGSTVRFPGFMAIYTEGQDEEQGPEEEEGLLPELAEGQPLEVQNLDGRQHFTQAPPRYTEAMLVKVLEEKGIGRPSTYAPIIETIQFRGYVAKEDRRFLPTNLGTLVIDLLKEHFPKIIDVEFTAQLEDRLDEIEAGRREWQKVVGEFYDPFAIDLSRAEEIIGPLDLPEEESDQVCDKCGARMVVKYGRFGKFLACPKFPDCKNTKPFVEVLQAKCPSCGAPMVERKSRKGRRFYGCSAYPDCRFVSWQKPVDRNCPECGAFLVQRKSKAEGDYYQCSREGCGYKEYGEPEGTGGD